jgi:hypothetical protein
MTNPEIAVVELPTQRLTKALGKEIVAVMSNYPNITSRLSGNDHEAIKKLVKDTFNVELAKNTFKSYLARAKVLARPRSAP